MSQMGLSAKSSHHLRHHSRFRHHLRLRAVAGLVLSALLATAGIRTVRAAEESTDVATTTQSQEQASLDPSTRAPARLASPNEAAGGIAPRPADNAGRGGQDSAPREPAGLHELLVPQTVPPPALARVAQGSSSVPSILSLQRGDLRSVLVQGVTRVAIGNPDILDVTIVSVNEVLLQAKAFGTTNLILWDEHGQSATAVEVVDPTTEVIATQLREVIRALDLPEVQVRREEDKIFMTGEVPRQEDLDHLEQIISAYGKQVTSLVTLPPAPPPPPPTPPQTVQLTVQLIEMSRDDTDKFGVDWSHSTTITETPYSAQGPVGIDLHKRLGTPLRWGALSRTGLSGVVSMLVTQGKARILAEPKLVASSGSEATATLGVEVPVITASSVSSGTVTQSIAFKQTGLELKFTPTVLEDQHSIQLVLDSKVSSIDKTSAITVSGIVVPGFKVRHAQTQIVTDSGETILITGLLQDEEKKNLSQLPGLGSIPVLGNLFRSTEFTMGRTELVIMVTPDLRADAGASEAHNFALEQALSSAELPGAVNDPVLRYALQIQDRVAKSIRYPSREKEMGISGRVKLRLHLFRDGTLGNAMISEPSGVEVLDREALQAVESQAPYPPFPSDLPQQELWLELPVLFKP